VDSSFQQVQSYQQVQVANTFPKIRPHFGGAFSFVWYNIYITYLLRDSTHPVELRFRGGFFML